MTSAHNPELRGAGKVVGLIVAEALAYDVGALLTGRETISNAVRRSYEVRPRLTAGALVYLGLHCIGKIHKRLDPLDQLWEHVPKPSN